MIILRVLKLQTERQHKYFLLSEEMGTCELQPLPFEVSCVLTACLQFESCAFCHPALCGLNKKLLKELLKIAIENRFSVMVLA